MANLQMKIHARFYSWNIRLCVALVFLPLCVANTSVNGADPHAHIDKPGFQKLYRSSNNEICSAVGNIINSGQRNRADALLKAEIHFARWEISRNVDRGDIDGPLLETAIDINNDGMLDKVIKVKWSIGGALTDALYVHPRGAEVEGAHPFPLRRLISEANAISFIESRDSIERLKQEHGSAWQTWFFDGIAIIDPFTYKNQTYVFAQNVRSRKDVSLKTYVFQLDRSQQVTDVCMFHRVCSCQGCQDLRGEELTKALPSARWCSNKR